MTPLRPAAWSPGRPVALTAVPPYRPSARPPPAGALRVRTVARRRPASSQGGSPPGGGRWPRRADRRRPAVGGPTPVGPAPVADFGALLRRLRCMAGSPIRSGMQSRTPRLGAFPGDRVLDEARHTFLPQLELEVPIVRGGQTAAQRVSSSHDSFHRSGRRGGIKGPAERAGQTADGLLHRAGVVGEGVVQHPLPGRVAMGQVEPRHARVIAGLRVLPLVEVLVEQGQYPGG